LTKRLIQKKSKISSTTWIYVNPLNSNYKKFSHIYNKGFIFKMTFIFEKNKIKNLHIDIQTNTHSLKVTLRAGDILYLSFLCSIIRHNFLLAYPSIIGTIWNSILSMSTSKHWRHHANKRVNG